MTKPDQRGTPIETCLVRVRGLVQGVGYRYSCVQQAKDLGIGGWVRNRTDGSVEAMLQGRPEQVRRMRDWMRNDVPGARVESIDVADVGGSPPRFDRFEQRTTT